MISLLQDANIDSVRLRYQRNNQRIVCENYTQSYLTNFGFSDIHGTVEIDEVN